MICPCCGYDLSGLPAEHLCPECGFAYDPTVIVVELQKAQHWAWPLIGTLLYVGLLFWFVPIYKSRKPEAMALFIVIGGSVLAQLWRAFLSTGAATRFVLSRSGVLLLRTGGDRDQVWWSQVATIKQSFWTGALCIFDSNRRVVLRCSFREFENRSRKVRKCIHEIERRKGIYGRKED